MASSPWIKLAAAGLAALSRFASTPNPFVAGAAVIAITAIVIFEIVRKT